MKNLIIFLLFLTLYGCGGASTEITTDTAASAKVDAVYSPNTPITQTIEVRHKYSYVNLNEDGIKISKIAINIMMISILPIMYVQLEHLNKIF